MDAVNARVTEPAEIVDTSSRGKRVVINFDTEYGNEAKIWCDPDDGEGQYARSLSEGQELLLMKGKNDNGVYYTFRDSDVENFEGAPSQPSQQQSQNTTQSQSNDQFAKKHADLIAACYMYLDKRFRQMQDSGDLPPDRVPGNEQLQKMAVSAAMEATD